MDAQRWAIIESVYHAALEKEPGERSAYLAVACADDAALRNEVESLLGYADAQLSSPAEPLRMTELLDKVGGITLSDAAEPVPPAAWTAGTRLGPYVMLKPIAAGGMGEVYCARDTRLERQVAIKILPETFASNPDRMARFQREAKVLASLNHSNIAQIYDVEERALVMELIEGPTLADRIKEGALRLEDALAIARQVASALEAAHEKGIVHRDLKPANIKVKSDGTVKVLDFGLAKSAKEPCAAEDPRSSPPQITSGTPAGMILGTATYMSPEQARGSTVDRRADIWAFGCVLYEMLTGMRVFRGEMTSDILAAVLRADPDWSALPGTTPARIRRLLRRCLERDRNQRLQAIGEARIAIDSPEEMTAQPSRSRLWPWVAAALVLAGAVGWWRAAIRLAPPHSTVRLIVDLGPNAVAGGSTTAAISPDGQRLVFPARGLNGEQQLATRLLDEAQLALLPGTENGHDPFFSPDGQSVGFFADGKLKKISVRGGLPVALCDAVSPRGGSWGEDGYIVAALGQQDVLWRVPDSGGTPQRLTTLGSGEVTHRWPQVLDGGQVVLFTASHTNVGQDDASIEVVSKTGATKTLLRGGYYGRYVPGGYLVYVHQGVLFGLGFDEGRLEVRGTPKPLVEDVADDSTMGGGQFDFSRTGTLVYLSARDATASWRVAWLDSSGKIQPILNTPGTYYFPRFSPDGTRLALVVGSKGNDIFVYDWQRNSLTRVTFDGHSYAPVWHPDGKHLAFRSTITGFSLSWVRSDGEAPQRLLEGQNNLIPYSFSPNGRRLAYQETGPNTGFDIWTLPLDATDPDHPKPGKPEPFLRTASADQVPVFSSDGRWIAYRSNESGTYEIYVRRFPEPGAKWRISTDGGLYAFWSRNGHELFYEAADNRIMVVDYKVNADSFVPNKPRLWSERNIFYPGVSNLDLAPDGKRFAVFLVPETARPEKGSVHLIFILNFFDELRRRVPTAGK